VLGAPGFDVTEIDLTSLTLHGAKPTSSFIQDVNGDGTPDLVISFDRAAVRIDPYATQIQLGGWLKNSQIFFGIQKLNHGRATQAQGKPDID
jgi:hypothetical protein